MRPDEKDLTGNAGYRIQTPLVRLKGRHKIDLTNAEIEDLLSRSELTSLRCMVTPAVLPPAPPVRKK